MNKRRKSGQNSRQRNITEADEVRTQNVEPDNPPEEQHQDPWDFPDSDPETGNDPVLQWSAVQEQAGELLERIFREQDTLKEESRERLTELGDLVRRNAW